MTKGCWLCDGTGHVVRCGRDADGLQLWRSSDGYNGVAVGCPACVRVKVWWEFVDNLATNLALMENGFTQDDERRVGVRWIIELLAGASAVNRELEESKNAD